MFRGDEFKVRDAVQTREGYGREAAVLPAFTNHAAGIAVQQESRFLEFLICMQAEDNTPRMIQVLRRAESPPVKSSHVHLQEETHVVGIHPLIVWHHLSRRMPDGTPKYNGCRVPRLARTRTSASLLTGQRGKLDIDTKTETKMPKPPIRGRLEAPRHSWMEDSARQGEVVDMSALLSTLPREDEFAQCQEIP